MKKSIFEFGDKFGVESPFGDWMGDKEQIKFDKPFFEYVNVVRQLRIQPLHNETPYIIEIQVRNSVSKIEVEISNKRYIAKENYGQVYKGNYICEIKFTDLKNDENGFLIFHAYYTDINKSLKTIKYILQFHLSSDGFITYSKYELSEIRLPIEKIKPSLELYAFIKEFEGLRLDKATFDKKGNILKLFPYSSIEGGADTIGYGHKLKKGEDFKDGITLEQAEQMLFEDVEQEGVKKLIRYSGKLKITVPLTQNEFDSLVSAVFNNGFGDTLASAVNNFYPNYDLYIKEVYSAFLKRRFAGTRELDGLISRPLKTINILIVNNII